MRRPAVPRLWSTARSGSAQARWRCVTSASALRSPPPGLWAMTARGDALLRQKATRPRRLARCHPSRATPRRAKTIWRQATEAVVPLRASAGLRLIASEQPDQLALDAYAVGREDSDLVGGIGGLERNRGTAAAETLEGRLFFVDQRHHNVAGIGPLGLLEQRDVAVEDAGLDHAVAAHLEREMLAGREHVGRHVDNVALGLDRLNRCAGGDAAHDRHRHRASAFVLRCGPHAAEIPLDYARREPACSARADAVRDRLRQLDYFDGAGTIGETADEAAFLQRRDQAVDPGFGTQVERVLHLVEGGRHAGLFEALVDEAQQFELFAGQHLAFPHCGGPKRLAETNHEQTLYVRYVFRNHLIWREHAKENPKSLCAQPHPGSDPKPGSSGRWSGPLDESPASRSRHSGGPRDNVPASPDHGLPIAAGARARA